MLTSNKGIEEWGRILGDEVMAAAPLDRLLRRCHIINVRGNSYRMRRHAETLARRSIRWGPEQTPHLRLGEQRH